MAAAQPDSDAVAKAMRALGVRQNSGLPADKTNAAAVADAQRMLGVTENTDQPSVKPKASPPALKLKPEVLTHVREAAEAGSDHRHAEPAAPVARGAHGRGPGAVAEDPAGGVGGGARGPWRGPVCMQCVGEDLDSGRSVDPDVVQGADVPGQVEPPSPGSERSCSVAWTRFSSGWRGASQLDGEHALSR